MKEANTESKKINHRKEQDSVYLTTYAVGRHKCWLEASKIKKRKANLILQKDTTVHITTMIFKPIPMPTMADKRKPKIIIVQNKTAQQTAAD